MKNNSFNYKYSAPTENERREIESIKRQYISDVSEEGKLERLKRLHFGVKRRATLASVFLGVFGMLIFGSGMALILEFSKLATGVTLSALGVVPMAFAYPTYKMISKSQKKKYSEEIIHLSNELLG